MRNLTNHSVEYEKNTRLWTQGDCKRRPIGDVNFKIDAFNWLSEDACDCFVHPR